MHLYSGIFSRLKIGLLVLAPWFVVPTALGQTMAIEEGCPENDAERLDIDFRYSPWPSCDSEKTCRPTAITNIEVSASPKLGWSEAGLGSNMGFVEAPNKTLDIQTYWSAETVSGICITNFDADDFGRVTVDYVDADAPGVPKEPIEFPFNAGLISDYAGSSEIFVRVYPTDGSPGDGLLVKSAYVEALSRDTGFTVAGFNLSETVTVDCSLIQEIGDCGSPDVNTGKNRKKVVASGELDGTIYNLTEESSDSTAYAAEFKLERVLTVVDPRDCSDPLSPPGKLLVNINDGASEEVPAIIDDATREKLEDSANPAILIPETSCGIEVLNARGGSNQIIRIAKIEFDFLRELYRPTQTEERIEIVAKFLLPLAESGESLYPECAVQKDAPNLLWLPIPAYDTRPENEVPVLFSKDESTAAAPLLTMIEAEVGCGSVRTIRPFSLIAWNTKPAAYLIEDTDSSPEVDTSLEARKNLVLDEIALAEQLNQQTEACLTTGEVTSTFASLLFKLARQVSNNDWNRSIQTAKDLESALDTPDVIADMSTCYWDWELEDLYTGNPVYLPPGESSGLYKEPAGLNQLLWGLVKHLQWEICARLTDGNWDTPELTEACVPLETQTEELPE
jgi:hypothetical protein